MEPEPPTKLARGLAVLAVLQVVVTILLITGTIAFDHSPTRILALSINCAIQLTLGIVAYAQAGTAKEGAVARVAANIAQATATVGWLAGAILILLGMCVGHSVESKHRIDAGIHVQMSPGLALTAEPGRMQREP